MKSLVEPQLKTFFGLHLTLPRKTFQKKQQNASFVAPSSRLIICAYFLISSDGNPSYALIIQSR